MGKVTPFGQRQFLGKDSVEWYWPPMLPLAGRMITSILREVPRNHTRVSTTPSDYSQGKTESGGQHRLFLRSTRHSLDLTTRSSPEIWKCVHSGEQCERSPCRKQRISRRQGKGDDSFDPSRSCKWWASYVGLRYGAQVPNF